MAEENAATVEVPIEQAQEEVLETGVGDVEPADLPADQVEESTKSTKAAMGSATEVMPEAKNTALETGKDEIEQVVYSTKHSKVDFRKTYDGEISAVVGDRVIAELFNASVRVDRFFYVYDRFGKLKGKAILVGQYGLRELLKPVQTDRLETGWYIRSKLKVDYNAKLSLVKKQLEAAKKKLLVHYNSEQKKMRNKLVEKRLQAKAAEQKKIEKEVQTMHQHLKKLRNDLNAEVDGNVRQAEISERKSIQEKIEQEEQYIRERITAELSEFESAERQKVQAVIESERAKEISKIDAFVSQLRSKRLQKVEKSLDEMGSELATYEKYLQDKNKELAISRQQKSNRQPSNSPSAPNQ